MSNHIKHKLYYHLRHTHGELYVRCDHCGLNVKESNFSTHFKDLPPCKTKLENAVKRKVNSDEHQD